MARTNKAPKGKAAVKGKESGPIRPHANANRLSILKPKAMEWEFISANEPFKTWIRTQGWGEFLKVQSNAYTELVKEFYVNMGRPLHKTVGSLQDVRKFYDRLFDAVKALVDQTGLGTFFSHLRAAAPRSSPEVTAALVERWSDTTHTFHMATGEFTITPVDFAALTRLSFTGTVIHFNFVFELSGRDRDMALFPRVNSEVCWALLPSLVDLVVVSTLDWARAGLAQMYYALDLCAHEQRKDLLCSPILLQAWAYEHGFLPPPVRKDAASYPGFPRITSWMDFSSPWGPTAEWSEAMTASARLVGHRFLMESPMALVWYFVERVTDCYDIPVIRLIPPHLPTCDYQPFIREQLLPFPGAPIAPPPSQAVPGAEEGDDDQPTQFAPPPVQQTWVVGDPQWALLPTQLWRADGTAYYHPIEVDASLPVAFAPAETTHVTRAHMEHAMRLVHAM
ncbi:Unknown protein [Striga hermonthica]|uniref:Aminotransferase-like plant mobile domain-containing protein n=1 Tax=Striga hermonthica TaxID=68872 RepID=A0A9N7RFI1_STRHE|nr:Unknown protein [Striga hermonthica]